MTSQQIKIDIMNNLINNNSIKQANAEKTYEYSQWIVWIIYSTWFHVFQTIDLIILYLLSIIVYENFEPNAVV
jgi:hypothetical protein